MKTPVQPQQLVEARRIVTEKVLGEDVNDGEGARAIKEWHQKIQVWQDEDELHTAFDEGRLTYRSMCHPGGSYSFTTKDTGQTRILGIINNDNYMKPVLNTATQTGTQATGRVWEMGDALPVQETKQSDQKLSAMQKWKQLDKQSTQSNGSSIRLDGGAAGIIRRTTPENFVKQTDENKHSIKFNLGLHDLSASLLNPDGYTLKNYTETVLVVLVPLPLPEDVELFYKLQKLCKNIQLAQIKSAYEVMSMSFCRPKLASALDMGTQYTLVKGTKPNTWRVKYLKASSGATSQDSATVCHTNARVNYRTIIAGTNAANEITVAYRRVGVNGTRFPIIGICEKNATAIKEIAVSLPPKSPLVRGAFYKITGYEISLDKFVRTQVSEASKDIK